MPDPALGRPGTRRAARRAGDHRRAPLDRHRRAGLARLRRRPASPRARAHGAAAATCRGGHGRRSGAAGDLQQPLHVHRRADGRDAGEDRLDDQHQGAARLLLRAVRCHRRTGRQCAAHAGAPRFDVHVRAYGDRPQPGHGAGRHVRAQRSLPRRHTPARRDGGGPGPRSRPCGAAVLRRGARSSRRHRRQVAGLDAGRLAHRGRGRGADRQLPAGPRRDLRRGGADGGCWVLVRIRRATRTRTWQTSRPRWPPAAAGCARSVAWWRTSGSMSCGPT